MSDTTLSPGFVRFIQHRLPTLEAGNYRLRVTQAISVNDVPLKLDDDGDLAQTQYFAVAGERFGIDPSEIDSVYPGPASQGEYTKVLPHLVLSRPMLPWLRSPESEPGVPQGDDDVPSWLALLVFDDSEAPPLQSLTLGALSAPSLPTGTISYPIKVSVVMTTSAGVHKPSRDIPAEFGYDDATPCQAIDIPWDLFASVAPSLQDLAWIATVRSVSASRKAISGSVAADAAPDEYAMIMANRLPQPGRKSTVHLVSLEGMEPYLAGGAVRAETTPLQVRLVSLYRWSFDALDDKETFGDALEALRPRMAQLGMPAKPATAGADDPSDPAADALVKQALDMGYVALPHLVRDGGCTASWYRGPLSPVPSGGSLLAGGPVGSADAATLFDPATGLFDLSYAAAWQIGCMLALADPAFSQSFYRWRHATALAVTQTDEAAFLHAAFAPQGVVATPPGATLHGKASDLARTAAQLLAGRDPAPAIVEADATPAGISPPTGMPADLAKWLAELRMLKGVPFVYLVPMPDMLPPEAIRFFHVDDDWLDALVDGAYSLGAATAGDIAVAGSTASAAPLPPTPSLCGLLLRSHVVRHWPGIQVEAFDSAGTPLKLVRFDKLDDSVLLCLFEGEFAAVDLHEPPEAMHYGVDILDAPDGSGGEAFGKQLRDCVTGAQSKTPPTIDTLPMRGAPGVIDISALADAARTASAIQPPHRFTSAEFALAMVEGVDRVTFVRPGMKNPHESPEI